MIHTDRGAVFLITVCAALAGCAAQPPVAPVVPKVECPGGAPLQTRQEKDRTGFWCKSPTEESYLVGEASTTGEVFRELRYRAGPGGSWTGTLRRFGSEHIEVDYVEGEATVCRIEGARATLGLMGWELVMEQVFAGGRVVRIRHYHDGALAEEEQLDAEGRRDGVHTQYWPSGKVMMSEQLQHGKPHGTTVRYREDGKKRQVTELSEGQPHGTTTAWDAAGTKRFEATYGHGLPDGPYSVWDESGYVLQQGHVTQGEGYFVEVDDEGRLTRDGYVQNGAWEGPFTDHYPSGKRRVQGRIAAGKLHGPWAGFWENGNERTRGQFVAGAPYGVWSVFDGDGKVQYRGTLTAQWTPDGVWQRFLPDGSAAGEDVFDNGVQTSPPSSSSGGFCPYVRFEMRDTGEVLMSQQSVLCPGRQIAQ